MPIPSAQKVASPWRPALYNALPVVALVTGLMYYWFAIADRHIVFLYYHDMGAVVPDTSPFSPVTGSRYWMTGLVAGGAVMLLYLALNWLLSRLLDGYVCPPWYRVWVLCAPALLIAVPAITLTVNTPRLPLVIAAQTTAATLVGLALALLPGSIAAKDPISLICTAADGLWVMLVMVSIAGLQNLPRWQAGGGDRWVRLVILLLVSSVVWSLIVTALRFLSRTPISTTVTLFLAGACVAYLFLPLLHHVAFTDGYYYITNSSNSLADDLTYQSAAWLIAGGMILGVTALRRALAGLSPGRWTRAVLS